jgi:hypothetical protein
MGTDIYLHVERRAGSGWQYCGELEELEDRNYAFFAILANVKNPIRSAGPFRSIAPQRGLPPDLAAETESAPFLCSGHDPGWVLARELHEFDWDGNTIVRSAIILPQTLVPLFGDGRQRFPADRIHEPYMLAAGGPGERVTWVDTYRDAVNDDFLQRLLQALAKFGAPDDVRLVFSFDS